jgi:Cof subfamily protein (haloacid dehalogenase superfamily)
MTKIYFFDIDNTLLDHNTNAIPDSALVAIAALKRAGNTVVIATGRSYGHAKPFIDQVRPSYAITQNGARILKGEKEVLALPLARKPLIDLFNWMRGQGHYFGVNNGDIGFISDPVPWIMEAMGTVAMAVQTDSPFYLTQDVYQGWLFFDESLDDRLYPAITERYPEFDLVRWHPKAIDVMSKAVNKWTACQWVMEQAGFAPDQAIAFGDGLNDIEMLQGVGLGVAMGNGHPAAKAAANRVAPALHHDGIATILNELALARAHGQPG